MTVVAKVAVHLFAQDAATGATPTLFAATEPVPGGSYAGPGNRRELAGPPVLVGRSLRPPTPPSPPGCGRHRKNSLACDTPPPN